eukprot:m.1241590 g.1241590  ORF g.1241590 m.1241590 type:complete len:62 (-) comp24680_c0_seq6:1283-1468(-)
MVLQGCAAPAAKIVDSTRHRRERGNVSVDNCRGCGTGDPSAGVDTDSSGMQYCGFNVTGSK